MDINIIMLNGTSRKMIVNPHDTVGSLKTRIQQELGVPSGTQKLVFINGVNTPLSDDSRHVSDYGVGPGASVSLLVIQPVTVQVFLRNEKGKLSTYDITPDETVDHFKKRVKSRESIPESQQRLIHQGREMTEPGSKLSHYNVQAMSTIDLNLRLRGG
ncbi:polyubiquitin-like [Anarrhichthys ocellatus]|uniref:polyubiquitin-like n=1 Tax=Anarrhichthys ocellatus TaxID=433405 RepID=UPI0012ED641D|nr:polyubiquitin-like [Anarrhichthys ocellatus]XP_031697268.1 polyubiquitin-like [Anarrhichthys ocellatus]